MNILVDVSLGLVFKSACSSQLRSLGGFIVESIMLGDTVSEDAIYPAFVFMPRDEVALGGVQLNIGRPSNISNY